MKYRSVAQRIEQDRSADPDHVSPDNGWTDGDPVRDAEASALALRKIGPCGYGAVARHLRWGATRAGRAETVLRLAGRIVYDRTGRGRLVDEQIPSD